jgi:hypothetical protein
MALEKVAKWVDSLAVWMVVKLVDAKGSETVGMRGFVWVSRKALEMAEKWAFERVAKWGDRRVLLSVGYSDAGSAVSMAVQWVFCSAVSREYG